MTLKFFNTLSGEIDEFVSIEPKKVRMYSCGPTVYSYAHIGNWAAYIYWDILVRILKLNGYDVTRVMNITDVGHLTSDADDGEDKLQASSKRENKTAWEIAEYYTKYFLSGLDRLNIITPDHITKATDYINQQLDLIRLLKNKGYTYQTSDGIYYDTSMFKTYSDFAKLDISNQKSGKRVNYNPEKKHPSDFAVWKFSPKNEKRDMEWVTPTDILSVPCEDVVMGFPGWHVECSAMAMNILGDTIDIHTGGIDAIPVHHTNEIAQSEAVTGKTFCNYWLHNNFLMVNNTKISKSLGNVYTLEDIESKGYSLLDFRMFVLQGSYRNEGNFTFKALDAAKNRLNKWRKVAVLRHQIYDTINNDSDTQIAPSPSLSTSDEVINIISNDLGTPNALKIIDNVFSKILLLPLPEINYHSFNQLLKTIDQALGLKLIDSTPDISDELKQLIIERRNARDQKDWEKSDKIRLELLENGIVIKDQSKNSVWEYKD